MYRSSLYRKSLGSDSVNKPIRNDQMQGCSNDGIRSLRRFDHHEKQRQCPVCLDELSEKIFYGTISKHCRHTGRTICEPCVYRHVQQALSETFTNNVRCPELTCGIELQPNDIRRILKKQNDIASLDRYDLFAVQRELEQIQEFIWCAHGCGTGQLNEGGSRNNIVTCVKCRKKTCFIHKTKWHEGLTCNRYDAKKNPEQEASRYWIARNCKKCPNCSCRIEKADGCDHMTCTKCHYEFCWFCLADYNDILQDGNHRHDSKCEHYAAY